MSSGGSGTVKGSGGVGRPRRAGGWWPAGAGRRMPSRRRVMLRCSPRKAGAAGGSVRRTIVGQGGGGRVRDAAGDHPGGPRGRPGRAFGWSVRVARVSGPCPGYP
ncbi:hypothetical protein GCM10022285_23130 [Streptomyces tunisiensis]|uniref:Uncharacterized protein n=1 Tax=Streptomyces tunisiensis TaxID=948699 RepID=A0ABP7Y9D0_9ACTN